MLTPWAVALLLFAAPEVGATDPMDAKALFQNAERLFELNSFLEAARQFEASYAIRPLPLTRYNIARCYERSGQLTRAVDGYRAYLRQAPAAPDRADVQALLAQLAARLAAQGVQTLTLTSTPTRAEVSVDGRAAGQTPLTVELPPGRHAVRLEARGRRTVELLVGLVLAEPREIDVPMSEATAAALPLDAPTVVAPIEPIPSADVVSSAQASATPPRARRWTWVATGVAVVGAGAGAGLGLGASSVAGSVKDGTVRPQASADELVRKGQGLADGANVAWAFAGAAAVTAIVLYFVEGP
jgi:hypothetical protein